MGKDSLHYKEKKKKQLVQLRLLLQQLPGCAVDYIHSKEVTSETSTLISYSYDLLTFFRFLTYYNPTLKNIPITDISYHVLEQIKPEDLEEYQRYLELSTEQEYHENSKKSIARKMSSLRGMFQYHYIRKNISENPTLLVTLPHIKKDKNIVRMNNYEVQSIISTIENGLEGLSKRQQSYAKKTQKRDLAIFILMVNTGIRVSECQGLDLTDVDFIVNSLTIVRKGGGQDIIYFGNAVKSALEDYIDNERFFYEEKASEQDKNALFYSIQGKRISVDAIENTVKKYAKIAVPNKKITPHKLRSTYGTALYRETGDIRLVADVLGHENVNTTIDYYAAIEDEHKRQAANAVDFRRKD